MGEEQSIEELQVQLTAAEQEQLEMTPKTFERLDALDLQSPEYK